MDEDDALGSVEEDALDPIASRGTSVVRSGLSPERDRGLAPGITIAAPPIVPIAPVAAALPAARARCWLRLSALAFFIIEKIVI